MKIKETVAAIPMVNVNRAKLFYQETMGFQLETLSNTLDMYWVKSGVTRFLLYLRNEENKAEHTALSFTVENIEEAVDMLESRGVLFYTSEDKRIFDLDGSLSAWFQNIPLHYGLPTNFGTIF